MHLFGGVKIDVFADFRPWTYQAHVSREYVDELRQLVELVFADVVPRTSHARVAPSDGDKSFSVGTDAHRAELEQPEIPVSFSYTYLAVKNRTFGIDFDPNGEHEEKRAQ